MEIPRSGKLTSGPNEIFSYFYPHFQVTSSSSKNTETLFFGFSWMFQPTEALSEKTSKVYPIFMFIFVLVKSFIENSKVRYFNTFQACSSSFYFGVSYLWGSTFQTCSNKLKEIGKFHSFQGWFPLPLFQQWACCHSLRSSKLIIYVIVNIGLQSPLHTDINIVQIYWPPVIQLLVWLVFLEPSLPY